jgi:hypothetical protein
VRLLSIILGDTSAEIERPDAHTLVMTVRDGLIDDSFSTLPRKPREPFRKGYRSDVAGMTAEIEDVTPDARPRRVRFTFDRVLDDPAMLWITWEGRGFVPAPPPAVGGRASIGGIDWYAALMPE